MSDAAISFSDLLQMNEAETGHWRQWLEDQPEEVLDLPLGIARSHNVRELLQHIFAVELRFSQRLLGEPESSYDDIPVTNIASLFQVGETARANLRLWLAGADDAELERPLEFQTRSGLALRASRRKIFLHAMMHGVRHWAQLATFLRKQGYPTDWSHDFIMTSVWS